MKSAVSTDANDAGPCAYTAPSVAATMAKRPSPWLQHMPSPHASFTIRRKRSPLVPQSVTLRLAADSSVACTSPVARLDTVHEMSSGKSSGSWGNREHASTRSDAPEVTQGHTRSHGVVWGHVGVAWGHMGSHGVTWGHMGSHEVTRGHTRSHEVTRGHTRSYEVTQGHTRSHEVTRGHTRSHEVTRGHTRSHEVTRGRTRRDNSQ